MIPGSGLLGSVVIEETAFPILGVRLGAGGICCEVAIPRSAWDRLPDPFFYGVFDPKGELVWRGRLDHERPYGDTALLTLYVTPDRRARSLTHPASADGDRCSQCGAML